MRNDVVNNDCNKSEDISHRRALYVSLSIFTILFSLALSLRAAVSSPVTLVSVIPLPGFTGDFDHFAVDLKRNQLLLAAEEHHTLEVFDLKTGEKLRSVPGLKAPHTPVYVPERDEVFITDGDAAACIILSAADFHEVGRVALRPGADSALYDPASKIFYVANGGREEKSSSSEITEISVQTHKVVGHIEID